MKTLVLLRHAKSSWEDESLDDFDRPLNTRGRNDAKGMGQIAEELLGSPDLLLLSPALRTRQTADLFWRQQPPTQLDQALYLAPWETLLDLIQQQPDHIDRLWLLGHNPGLTELTHRLLPDLSLNNLPTAGLVAIQYPITQWAEAIYVKGVLKAFERPKKYRIK
ncbi:MAG: histidine phosphatase family protein [Bernardetiaceae bacterium]